MLCSNYTMNEGLPNFSYEVSVNSSMKFYKALGDVEFYNYKSSKVADSLDEIFDLL